MPPRKRIANFMTQLTKLSYLRYVIGRIYGIVADQCRQVGRCLWRLMHAGFPDNSEFGIAELEQHCRELDIPFKTTDNFHSEESLAFVAKGDPDLGIVYGTPILKPKIFEIPRLGCVNLHQRKVPDYRGGGPIGLWEMLDGTTEIGVTVHRVAAKLDAGPVIRASTIPIEPFDTLLSLEMKAHVVGIDLLAATVADFACDRVRETVQEETGRMFRTPKPEDLPALLRKLKSLRPELPTSRTYPSWKLLGRFAALLPWLTIRNWYRRLTGTFPIVVLYHHVITDRPHFMGMSTDRFISQMNYLRNYYNVVDLATAMSLLRSGRIHEPTVVLTFDDGYADNVLSLRAAALRGSVPATLYVCSENIDSHRNFAHDRDLNNGAFPPMSWDAVRTMETWGYHIGAHTRTHFDCGCSDPWQLVPEIIECRREIEAQIGHPINDFSFPFGLQRNISAQAFALARQEYATFASAYGGVNRAGQEGAGHVYRCPHLSSLLELELQLQSALVFGQPDFWQGDQREIGRTEGPRTIAGELAKT